VRGSSFGCCFLHDKLQYSNEAFAPHYSILNDWDSAFVFCIFDYLYVRIGLCFYQSKFKIITLLIA